MFLSALHHHHMHCCSNPFTMGFTAMNPRINFFLGMAAATSFMPAYPPVFVNPFGGSIWGMTPFSFPNFSYPNIFVTNNIFTPTVPSYNNFVAAPSFGALTTRQQSFVQPPVFAKPVVASVSSSTDKVEISEDIRYKSSSKIKPGLLKGNLVGKEEVITELCKKYDVDVALVVSIIGQESGFGTSNLAQHNNFMGYRAAGDLGKSPKGFGYFSTPEKGLEVAIRNLSKYPERYSTVKKADMNNIDAIGKIYCEGDTYSSAIKNIYNTTVKEYLA